MGLALWSDLPRQGKFGDEVFPVGGGDEWLSHPDTWEVAWRSIEFDLRLACCVSSIAIGVEGGEVSAALPDLMPKILQQSGARGANTSTI